MNKVHVLALAALALLAAPVASFANEWSSVCSSGAIDETSLGVYAVNGASLFFAPGMTGTVAARYNVTNTAVLSGGLGTETPGWTTFELGYQDTSTGTIYATLYEVHICDGAVTKICGAILSANSNQPTCLRCTISEAIDFSFNLYYVNVTIIKGDTAGILQANTLRIY